MKLLKKIAKAISSSRTELNEADSLDHLIESPAKRRKTLNGSIDDDIPYTPIELPLNSLVLQITEKQHGYIKKRAALQLETILRKCLRMSKKEALKTVASLSQVEAKVETSQDFSIFGCSLANLPGNLVNQETQLPTVILELMHLFASLGGFEQEGPFRLEGDKQILSQLIANISKGFPQEGTELAKVPIPVIAAAIKRYLRSIPGSLIPQSATSVLVKLFNLKDHNLRVLAIQLVILSLPFQHLKVLSTLKLFLKACSEREQTHKMSIEALAVCFGPTLFDTGMDLNLVTGANGLLQELITNHAHYLNIPKSILDC